MKKYVFVGNRFSVLEKMILHNCNIIAIYSIKDSFLSKELEKRKIAYKELPSKKQFIDDLENLDFDILISNGCPYILPVEKLKKGEKEFINIHPSLLPDLKGKSPINGAILFGRKHGVTCHFMDDGIDTGKIIEQIEIPIDDSINLNLLYHISFKMEGVVFEKALNNQFKPSTVSNCIDNPLYYSRQEEDLQITVNDDIQKIKNKVRAFDTKGQYAYLFIDNKKISLEDVCEIDNSAVNLIYGNGEENQVLAVYGEFFFLAKIKNKILQFKTVNSCIVNEKERIFV